MTSARSNIVSMMATEQFQLFLIYDVNLSVFSCDFFHLMENDSKTIWSQ